MNKIKIELKDKIGIYFIFNLKNGKRYIGSSKNIYNRLHEHIHLLKNDKAHNIYLQNSWNKYGEDNFLFGILEYCDLENLLQREQFYISTLSPEYNFSAFVISNTNRVITDEQKLKISNTLKEKYASGEISVVVHGEKPCYIYNIESKKIVTETKNMNNAELFLKLKPGTISSGKILNRIYSKKFIIVLEKFKSELELDNYINKNILMYSGIGDTRYLIVEYPANYYKYFRNKTVCCEYIGCAASTISKHMDATIDSPYIYKGNNKKLFFSNVFIENCRLLEESSKLLQTNIGEPCDGNTEINLGNKIPNSSYSVEIEPDLSE